MSDYRRLRRKLAIAYAVSSVAAILLVEAAWLLWLGWYVLRSEGFVEDLVLGTKETADEVAKIAAGEPVDRELLLRTISGAFTSPGPSTDEPIQFAIEVGPARTGLVTLVDGAGVPRHAFSCSRAGCVDAVAPVPTAAETERIQRALDGETAPTSLAFRRPDGGVSLALALRPPGSSREGAIWARLSPPFTAGSWARACAVFLATNGLAVAGLGGIVGFAFGAFMARRIARRLERLATAANAWASGDFDVVAASGSDDDELHDLAARLDAMALELRSLVALRGALAAAEERSRLARELHDGVKQQLFAIAMLLGAARATAGDNPGRTTARIDEATTLLERAQRELVAVLAELRPPSLDVRWPVGLRREVRAWSERTEITADLVIGEAPLPPATCDALTRIAQEALSNVARHGAATHVEVRLDVGAEGRYLLTIEDDGVGIPPDAPEGFGIVSMRQRAEGLPSGTFRVKRSRRGGACIEVAFREAV